MSVRAYYRGGKKLYPGRISKANSDGTFNITYDDGDREVHVQRNLIEIEPAEVDDDEDPLKFDRAAARDGGDREDGLEEELSPGTRVEARFQGRSRWHGGKVVKYDGDRSYTIKYDDGDVESYVGRKLIRVVDKSEETLALIDRIISSGIQTGDIDDYHEAFEMFDANANGKISASEFGRAMKSMGIRVNIYIYMDFLLCCVFMYLTLNGFAIRANLLASCSAP